MSQLPPNPILPSFTPTFPKPINTDWYKRHTEITDSIKLAKATDMAFVLCRHNEEENKYVGWTEFNQRISRNNAKITAQGYLPLILNPAHEYNTLLLFLQRAISLADSLNYRYKLS